MAPSARRTLRLTDLLTVISFALGGEAGKRLCQQLHLISSPDTLLRLIRSHAAKDQITPRVLGVDEWSYRRGQRFGTILIDLERRLPVELLPDRESETFAKWLAEHQGVEIISRDRGGSFAEGARQGTPQAIQVADRFHLLANLSERLEGFFLHKRTLLKEAAADPPEESPRPATPLAGRRWTKGVTKRQEEAAERRHQQSIDQFHRIHELRAKKADIADIARIVGVARRTVYYYLQMDHPPERRRLQPVQGRTPLVEPYKPYLIARWNEGCRNARCLYREIVAQGYSASYANVERFLSQFRTKEHKFKQEPPATRPVVLGKKHKPFTALQAARLMTVPPEKRGDAHTQYLSRLCQADSAIATTYELAQAFASMLRKREGEQLDDWIAQVQEQGVPELRAFAQGLKKDYDAVKAGLTLEWSQGQVEGQIHRVKLLKRQSYGRAGFETLRARVLHRG